MSASSVSWLQPPSPYQQGPRDQIPINDLAYDVQLMFSQEQAVEFDQEVCNVLRPTVDVPRCDRHEPFPASTSPGKKKQHNTKYMYDGYSSKWGDIKKNRLLSMYYLHRGYHDRNQIDDTNMFLKYISNRWRISGVYSWAHLDMYVYTSSMTPLRTSSLDIFHCLLH
jgi:hypothetical protein